MVECIGDDGVVFVEQWFEQVVVGIEVGCIENGVLFVEEVGDLFFQLFVQVLGVVDEVY